MKWVAKSTRIIVCRGDGRAAYTSLRACPPALLKHVRKVARGSQTHSVMVANREAVRALRRNGSADLSVPVGGRAVVRSPDRWHGKLPRRLLMAAAGFVGFGLAVAVWAWMSDSQAPAP